MQINTELVLHVFGIRKKCIQLGNVCTIGDKWQEHKMNVHFGSLKIDKLLLKMEPSILYGPADKSFLSLICFG